MKKNLFRIFLSLFLIAAVTTVTSCNSSGNNDSPIDPNKVVYNIATLTSFNENVSVFTIDQDNDDANFTMTFSNVKLNPEVFKVDTRYLIAYQPDNNQPGTSGTGYLAGVIYVYNSVITEGTAQSTNEWMTLRQDLTSVWRSGKWINIQTKCTYVGDAPKVYNLVVDETTLENEYPDAYLIYDYDNTNPDLRTRDFYATFDISSVWTLPTVKGLRVHILATNGLKTETFLKNTGENITPVG